MEMYHIVLLKEADNIMFASLLDIIAVISGLRIEYLYFRLDLAYCVQILKFTNRNSLLIRIMLVGASLLEIY